MRAVRQVFPSRIRLAQAHVDTRQGARPTRRPHGQHQRRQTQETLRRHQTRAQPRNETKTTPTRREETRRPTADIKEFTGQKTTQVQKEPQKTAQCHRPKQRGAFQNEHRCIRI